MYYSLRKKGVSLSLETIVIAIIILIVLILIVTFIIKFGADTIPIIGNQANNSASLLKDIPRP